MPKNQTLKDRHPWIARYSDGSTFILHSPFQPSGSAMKHLRAEQNKGNIRSDVTLVSVKHIAEEAEKRPMKPMEHASLSYGKNVVPIPQVEPLSNNHSNLPHPTAEEMVIEHLEKFEEFLSEEDDTKLIELINEGIKKVEFLSLAYIKLYELTSDVNVFYDNIFLAEFVKRIRRALYDVDANIDAIIDNLTTETSDTEK